MAVSQVIIGGTEAYSEVSQLATPIQVKATGGTLLGWFIDNDAAEKRFVKLWNTASAPNPATDSPKLTLPIPKKMAANVMGLGINFDLGIWISCTKGRSAGDTSSPLANEVAVNLFYL